MSKKSSRIEYITFAKFGDCGNFLTSKTRNDYNKVGEILRLSFLKLPFYFTRYLHVSSRETRSKTQVIATGQVCLPSIEQSSKQRVSRARSMRRKHERSIVYPGLFSIYDAAAANASQGRYAQAARDQACVCTNVLFAPRSRFLTVRGGTDVYRALQKERTPHRVDEARAPSSVFVAQTRRLPLEFREETRRNGVEVRDAAILRARVRSDTRRINTYKSRKKDTLVPNITHYIIS